MAELLATIPRRDDLIQHVERANRIAGPWIVVQIVLIAVLSSLIDWQAVFDAPLVPVIAATVVCGPHCMQLLKYWVQRKKEIGDLKEQSRFGEFDKHRLRRLFDDVLLRLQLPQPGPPVYITADKTLNAGAMHLGLAGFFRSLNGVYLNRQVLHRLTPAEVQNVVGHELGHYYRYYLLNDRLQILTLALAALAGLYVTQWLGMTSMVSMVALSICGTAAWFVSGWLTVQTGETIEYLCDDYGAQVNGVVASINGLLKIGADGEMQAAVIQQEILDRRHGNLNARDVVEAIEAATPLGHTTREQLEAAVAESLKKRSQDRRRLSVGGFLEYAWNGVDEDAVDDEMKKIRAMQKVPRLQWESLLDGSGRIDLNERQIESLVEEIEADPERVLFQLPEEIGKGDGVHPPIRSRILYLWKNRREIEAAGRSSTRR